LVFAVTAPVGWSSRETLPGSSGFMIMVVVFLAIVFGARPF